jgi:ABC-2 type transport system ATP-binding protein
VVAQGSPGSLRDTGIRRYRIVLGGDAGWLRGRADVHVADVDRNVAVVEPLTENAPQNLLADAVRRGPVHEFAQIIPTLSEIYREVTA